MIGNWAIDKLRTPPRPVHKRAGGFTLIEMLVVVTIILGLAGMTMTAMSYVREDARAARTRSTIAKINQIIMQKWESFETRRVPVDMTGLSPRQAAEVRLQAIRILQKLEMPDRKDDIVDASQLNGTITLDYNKTMPYPAMARLFSARRPASTAFMEAKMLYLVCTIGNPEALEMFSDSEIGDYANDGSLEFLDGWGHPIYFLRWAPAFCPYSDIQSGNPETDHDPFDSQRVQPAAFHLIPLIYSAGGTTKLENGVLKGYGINASYDATGSNPFEGKYQVAGSPAPEEPGAIYDNITNHRIEH